MSTALVVLAFTLGGKAQPLPNTAEIVAKVSPAVVLVKGEAATGTVVASGFIVSPDGKIATNLHVIRDLKHAGVQLASGEAFDAVSVLAFDERRDLAIIKIAGFDMPIIELGNSNEIKAGEPVLVIGSPRGLQGTVTTGVVSALRDEPTGAGFKVIQTDAAVNPGNSGAPLLNSLGQAIGVVTAKIRGSEGLNFALPINYVRGMLANLQKQMSFDELRASLSGAKPRVFGSAGYPTLWKSLSSGKIRRLRFEGDFVYGETVFSEEERKQGFDSYELKRSQNGYQGPIRVGFTCAYGTWQTAKQCRLEHQIEFTTVTPTRIEGRVLLPPEGAKFDCKKCAYSRPSVWSAFVWIPE